MRSRSASLASPRKSPKDQDRHRSASIQGEASVLAEYPELFEASAADQAEAFQGGALFVKMRDSAEECFEFCRVEGALLVDRPKLCKEMGLLAHTYPPLLSLVKQLLADDCELIGRREFNQDMERWAASAEGAIGNVGETEWIAQWQDEVAKAQADGSIGALKEEAATQIQSVARGKVGRLAAHAQKEKQAAIKIQSVARGHKARAGQVEPGDAAAATEAGGGERGQIGLKAKALFDDLDEDDTGFVSRLDLADALEELVADYPLAQTLSETISDLSSVISERGDYHEIVNAWVEGVTS